MLSKSTNDLLEITYLFCSSTTNSRGNTFLQPDKLLSARQPKAEKRSNELKKTYLLQSTTTRNDKKQRHVVFTRGLWNILKFNLHYKHSTFFFPTQLTRNRVKHRKLIVTRSKNGSTAKSFSNIDEFYKLFSLPRNSSVQNVAQIIEY